MHHQPQGVEERSGQRHPPEDQRCTSDARDESGPAFSLRRQGAHGLKLTAIEKGHNYGTLQGPPPRYITSQV